MQVGLPDRVRLPIQFDAVRLQAELEHLSDAEWTPHFVPQNYEGEWHVLPLRAPLNAIHPILQIAANPGTVAWQSTTWLDRSPYLAEVVGSFRCDIAGVRLMRLAPGSLIREHRDERLGAEWGFARLHVPIVTSSNVDFRLNGTRLGMQPGETWYLRLCDPHSVCNGGTTDRVHLVIDAVTNLWLDGLLRAGAGSTA